MALIASAETAQDVASGLHKFLEPVIESSTEITGLIAECFAVSSALRELNDAVGDPRQNRRYSAISDDVRLVLLSLDYTFKDVIDLFGGLARTNHITQSSGYRQVWRDIEDHFQAESRNTLSMRLEYYKRFLQHLICIMIEGLVMILDMSDPPSDPSIDYLPITTCSTIFRCALTRSLKYKKPDWRMTFPTCRWERQVRVEYRLGPPSSLNRIRCGETKIF